MTKDEALKMALECLDGVWRGDYSGNAKEVITAIKEALAQPEQEPVAFINVEQRKLEWAKYMSWDTPTVVNLPKIPLYTTLPQRTWVGLTDEELDALYRAVKIRLMGTYDTKDIYRAVEAKLKEKNA